MTLHLLLLPDRFAICRLGASDEIPDWAYEECGFSSITRTDEELSIVCRQDLVPEALTSSSGWRCLKVKGPLDLEMTGVLAGLTAPLAEAGISTFAISTHDTDYLLVQERRLEEAIAVLSAAGCRPEQ